MRLLFEGGSYFSQSTVSAATTQIIMAIHNVILLLSRHDDTITSIINDLQFFSRSAWIMSIHLWPKIQPSEAVIESTQYHITL